MYEIRKYFDSEVYKNNNFFSESNENRIDEYSLTVHNTFLCLCFIMFNTVLTTHEYVGRCAQYR